MLFNRPLVAIDFGSSAMKVVELAGTQQKSLKAVGLEVMPSGAVVDGMIQNESAVQEILKSLIKKLKIMTAGRRAAISLSGGSLIIKRIRVPLAKDVDLSQQIVYEAEQHLQHDMNELYFDHYVLAKEPDSSGQLPVLLVAAKREMVEKHVAAVRACGMRVGVIDCDVFAVANMFEHSYGNSDSLIALVNVGAAVTQVSLVARGEYLYTRDVAIAGEEYSRRIMEALQVDRDNAEALKISASQGDPGSVLPELRKVLADTNEQLVAEVQMTIDFFFQSGDVALDVTGVSNLFLSGGGSRLLGLDAALAAAMHVPVQIVNPFQRVDVDPKKFPMESLLMQGHLYGVAVGLGMRAMNDRKSA